MLAFYHQWSAEIRGFFFTKVKGPWRAACQLQKLFKGPRPRWASCWKEWKRIILLAKGSLILQKIKLKKIELEVRPGSLLQPEMALGTHFPPPDSAPPGRWTWAGSPRSRTANTGGPRRHVSNQQCLTQMQGLLTTFSDGFWHYVYNIWLDVLDIMKSSSWEEVTQQNCLNNI